MRERYQCMIQLREQLAELFELCGMQTSEIAVAPMPMPLQWLEKLVQDNQLYNYLENLTSLSKQASVRVREMKLEAWNGLESERQLEEISDRLEMQEQQLARLEQSLQQLEREKAALRDQMAKEQKSAVQGIITLRDNLLMKQAWLETAGDSPEAAAKLISGQLQETAALLEGMGAEILQDTGAFDSRCHTAVETRPAENADQVGQIAETFRPGYRFRGEVLRPQEVIVYTE